MKYRLLLLIIILTIGYSWQSLGQWYNDPENHQCLKCHSHPTYTFHNSLMDSEEKRLMNPFFILDTLTLNAGVHKQFDCMDCHSYEYESYPHNSELKLEPLATCLDCHGGDDTFATYQFEKIDEEVRKSIHFDVYGEHFTCSKCHSQHTYAATARNSNNVLEIVNYSNQMCLSCHNDMKKYMLVSEHGNPELVEVHDRLPNQEL
ncbi:MAG: cytochrome c3 family protein, partial [Mariniphaga sp.]|nr:cytochrome c3 family protein [Mariniphaga sp.]